MGICEINLEEFNIAEVAMLALTEILEIMRNMRDGKRAAIVVTTENHTTCYLSAGKGAVAHFDSLDPENDRQSTLLDVTECNLMEKASRCCRDISGIADFFGKFWRAQYSAYVMCQR